MERSCIPPESAPAQSRTAPEAIPTSRIENVVRAKEMAKKVIHASDWLTTSSVLWLVETDHVTWILAFDWSIFSDGPGGWAGDYLTTKEAEERLWRWGSRWTQKFIHRVLCQLEQAVEIFSHFLLFQNSFSCIHVTFWTFDLFNHLILFCIHRFNR